MKFTHHDGAPVHRCCAFLFALAGLFCFISFLSLFMQLNMSQELAWIHNEKKFDPLTSDRYAAEQNADSMAAGLGRCKDDVVVRCVGRTTS